MAALSEFHDGPAGDDGEVQRAADTGRLTDAEHRAWRSVVQGGWRLFAQINQGLADAGFSSTPDLRVMEVLGRAERMRISDIAAATHIQMSTISRQIARLVDQGLVERVDEVKGDDARHRWVRPTKAGREYLQGLVEARDDQVHKHVVEVLGDEDFQTLGRLFGKLADKGEECSDAEDSSQH